MTHGLGNVLYGTVGIRTYTYSVELYEEEERQEKRVLIETEEINR